MFEEWRLNRKLAKIDRTYKPKLEKLQAENAEPIKFQLLMDEKYQLRRAQENMVDIQRTVALSHEARSLDLELPLLDETEFWFRQPNSTYVWLTPKGRSHVRKLIDDERGRRFEVKTRWVVKLILPILAGLIGVLGAITGLVAVFRHKP